MSTNESIRYGIDLGTTNSSIAILLGDRMQVVPSKFNQETTPSVVSFWRANGRTEVEVGKLARQMILRKGARVASEFKANMGDPSALFSGVEPPEKPFQLSARVLRELLGSVGRLADLPELNAAVITVPAAFKNPARDDTKRAGEAAGLAYVELFPEPAAAALAYGRTADTSRGPVWLAYDLGGGTFDAALVRGENGVFTVIDNEGDRHLGGKDLDAAIVTELVLPKLPAALRERVTRGSLEWELLKLTAEEAKCALSVQESVPFQAEIFGEDVFLTLQQSELHPLQAKLFGRTLKQCRDLLERNGFEPRHIEKVVLVGGPLLSPFLRSMIQHGYQNDALNLRIAGLGIDIDRSIDPLTAVAQGAAIRAAAQRIPAGTRFGSSDVDGRNRSAAVDVEMTVASQVQEEDVLIAGTLKALREDVAITADWAVLVERIDAGQAVVWRSAPVAVSAAGKFALRAALAKGHNRFEIRVLDGQRLPVAIGSSAGFDVLRGISTGELTLSRGFGVADDNGATIWFFRKGDPLDRKVQKLFTTTVALERGRTSDAIVIPVVEGFEDKASLNAEVYTLTISSQAAGMSVPAGAYIEVDLEIDKSQQLYVRAKFKDFPIEATSAFVSMAPEGNKVSERLALIRHDLELFRQVRAQSPAIAAAVAEIEQDDLIAEIEDLLALGSHDNPTPWDKAADRVLEVTRLLHKHRPEVDELLAWTAHKARCDANIKLAKEIVGETSGLSAAWLEEFARLCRQYDEACAKRDRALCEQIAFELIPAHFKQDEQLLRRVGTAESVATATQTAADGARTGTIRQA